MYAKRAKRPVALDDASLVDNPKTVLRKPGHLGDMGAKSLSRLSQLHVSVVDGPWLHDNYQLNADRPFNLLSRRWSARRHWLAARTSGNHAPFYFKANATAPATVLFPAESHRVT